MPDVTDPRRALTSDPLEKAAIAQSLFGSSDPPTLGRFRVRGKLGSGGMGVVYRAHDPKLQRDVAVKLLSVDVSNDDSQGHQRLLREAQAMARISHPNVLPVFEVGEHGDRIFVAMELVSGGTLRDVFGEEPRPSWRQIVPLFIQAGRGLAAAHAEGLVHRDFKPENVLVDRGSPPRARVMDFGLARPRAATSPLAERDRELPDGEDVQLTRTGALLGTPAYMSPEQFAGEPADDRSDQFSFCVALWEGLFGQRPFAGRSLLEIGSNVKKGALRRPPSLGGVPPALARTVERGLAADPADRHADMASLLAELEVLVRPRSRPWLLAGAALVVGGGAVAAVMAQTEPACAPASQRLAGIWDDAARGRLDAKFAAAEASYVARSWEVLREGTDAWVDTWTEQYQAACAEEVADDPAAQLLHAQRTACLDAALDSLAVLVELNEQTSAEAVAAAGFGADPSVLDVCADDAAITRVLPLPTDAETRALVATLRRDIDRVRRTHLGPDPQRCITEADALLERANGLGYAPVIVEAKALRAFAVRATHREDALPTLRAALEAADIAEHDAVAFELVAALVEELVGRGGFTDVPLPVDPSTVPERQHLLQRLRVAAQRSGTTRRMRDRVEYLEARSALVDGDPDRAIALHRQQLERAEAASSLGGQAVAWTRIADAQYVGHQTREALDSAKRAVDLWEQHLGPDHPAASGALSLRALLELRFARFTDGVASFRRATAALHALHPEGHPRVAWAESMVSLGQVMLGEPQAAIAGLLDAEKELTRIEGPDSQTTLRVATLQLVRLYLTRGEYDEVRPRLERLLAPTTDIETRAFGLALAAELEARLGHADAWAARFAEFEAIFDAAPATPVIRTGIELSRAIGYAHLDRPDEALAAAEAAVAGLAGDPEFDAVFPFDLQARVMLGHLLVAAGRPADALPHLEAALPSCPSAAMMQLIPFGAWVRADLARALVATGGDRERALRLAREALAGYGKLAVADLDPEARALARWVGQPSRQP